MVPPNRSAPGGLQRVSTTGPREAHVNVCIPILENRGLLSPVSPHFSAAPMFLLVDSATLAFRSLPNPPPAEGRRCDPYRALREEDVQWFIVGGIGQNALAEIARRNVPVHRTSRGTVADALAGWIAGRLPALRQGTDGPGWM
jgi:predicted Fe-Mo cluster-binding NifX family protein